MASFTLAKFPFPIVFISLYLPICGASSLRGARTPPDEFVVRLLRFDEDVDDPVADDGTALVALIVAGGFEESIVVVVNLSLR